MDIHEGHRVETEKQVPTAVDEAAAAELEEEELEPEAAVAVTNTVRAAARSVRRIRIPLDK